MLFNSIEFAIFLPVCFIIYWFILFRKSRLQNVFIVLASYFFYGWWDWRFLSLIAFSTLLDYLIGLKIQKSDKRITRRILLVASLVVNLGFLGVFKYYNFFIENFISAFTLFGKNIPISGLNIVLPVGISFYTFQTLSYSIDVYRKKLSPTNDFIAFAAFVSFFPQLVAGPIERATHLLPQFYNNRVFNHGMAVSGVKLIVWGLFKKVVVADNCAFFVDEIFSNYSGLSSFELIVGAVLFAFQIYGDFSGYSDIAIGTARLFGFSLMTNFKFPYLSRDIAEFWRRWHISLSSWFKDYLYKPLGGSKFGRFMTLRNIFIVFLVSGFWHGANWTFIVWGSLNALYYLPLFLSGKNRGNMDSSAQLHKSFSEMGAVFLTFSLTCLAWVFFRSATVTDAFSYLGIVLTDFSFSVGVFTKGSKYMLLTLITIVGISLMMIKEVRIYLKGLQEVTYGKIFFYILILAIAFMGVYKDQMSFIYFQF